MTQFVLANQTPQDEIGRTLPKSRLYFYENNTFNFKDVYSDTARTSVLPNPVIADGDGRFPVIYLAVNSNYRVSLKDRFDKQVTPFADNQGTSAQGLGTAAFSDLTSPSATIFDSGNLNYTVFPSYKSANVRVSACYGRTSSTVYIHLETNFQATRATVLDVTSTFSLGLIGATTQSVATGIDAADISFSSARSDRITVLIISGLSGITTNTTYTLTTETNTSEISLL